MLSTRPTPRRTPLLNGLIIINLLGDRTVPTTFLMHLAQAPLPRTHLGSVALGAERATVSVFGFAAEALMVVDLVSGERVLESRGEGRRRRLAVRTAGAVATRVAKGLSEAVAPWHRPRLRADRGWTTMQRLAGTSGGIWLPPADWGGAGWTGQLRRFSERLRVNRMIHASS